MGYIQMLQCLNNIVLRLFWQILVQKNYLIFFLGKLKAKPNKIFQFSN